MIVAPEELSTADPFTSLEPGQAVDMASLDYPFMPPFVGTEEEMEALVEYLASLTAPAEQVSQKGVTP